ncbi:MAG: hypothetical protein EA425_12295 [Puniceicoccaceae bacterium]|nr:MAG: hypothetical protein EA425_12295 [Puniceicoccaceae bacterium]
MDDEILSFPIGAELDATLERLSRIYQCPRGRLARVLLEEAAYSIEDTLDRSGQIWESIRFEFVHGGRRGLKRESNERAIDDLLRNVQNMEP